MFLWSESTRPSKYEKRVKSAESAVLCLKAVLTHLCYTEVNTEIISPMLRRRCKFSILTERLG